MINLFRQATNLKASDLHITVGVPPIVRINGYLEELPDNNKLQPADTERLLRSIANEGKMEELAEKGSIDFSFSEAGLGRFRVNAYHQRGSIAIAVRLVAESIATFESLGLPDTIKLLARKRRGLVLVVGPTGSGKSTTLAAMVDLNNKERKSHIITLEDPIEYLHHHHRSIINQREIHTDATSFSEALRATLREDPDIIMVGEMRDPETIATTITAAETGHLVFATLHTSDAAQTIDRIIDSFPQHQQNQIRMQLSMTLEGIIAQQLVPLKNNLGRTLALEILTATPAIRSLIREGNTHQITSSIETSSRQGMQTMDMALRNLYYQEKIEKETALNAAHEPDAFEKRLEQFKVK